MLGASLYLVTSGHGFLQLDGQEVPTKVEAGSFVFVRRDQGYSLRDSPRTPIAPLDSLFSSLAPDAAGVMRGGGDGALTTAVFGCFDFEVDHPLVAALPPMLHRRAGEDASVQ